MANQACKAQLKHLQTKARTGPLQGEIPGVEGEKSAAPAFSSLQQASKRPRSECAKSTTSQETSSVATRIRSNIDSLINYIEQYLTEVFPDPAPSSHDVCLLSQVSRQK